MNTTVFSSHTAPVAAAKPATSPLRTVGQRIDGAKSLAALLLVAMAAALAVLADQLISTWGDEHLLLAWIAFCVVAFAALALLASSSRHLASGLLKNLAVRRERARRARADERLWDLARSDARVMSDLQAAMSRAGD